MYTLTFFARIKGEKMNMSYLLSANTTRASTSIEPTLTSSIESTPIESTVASYIESTPIELTVASNIESTVTGKLIANEPIMNQLR